MRNKKKDVVEKCNARLGRVFMIPSAGLFILLGFCFLFPGLLLFFALLGFFFGHLDPFVSVVVPAVTAKKIYMLVYNFDMEKIKQSEGNPE